MSVTLFLAMVMLSAPGNGVVPVEQEPVHETIFRNEYVRAYRVRLEPGAKTLVHTHAHDDAAVRLSTTKIVNEVPGRPDGPVDATEPGKVSARTNEPVAYTHAVHNVGEGLFDVIDVEVLKRPAGAETPAIGEPAAENPHMRVYRYELAPGQASPAHTHKRPYLIIAATDMKLRMTAPDGAAMVHPVKAGDLHWIDATVTHSLANDGNEKGVIVEFELK